MHEMQNIHGCIKLINVLLNIVDDSKFKNNFECAFLKLY